MLLFRRLLAESPQPPTGFVPGVPLTDAQKEEMQLAQQDARLRGPVVEVADEE